MASHSRTRTGTVKPRRRDTYLPAYQIYRFFSRRLLILVIVAAIYEDNVVSRSLFIVYGWPASFPRGTSTNRHTTSSLGLGAKQSESSVDQMRPGRKRFLLPTGGQVYLQARTLPICLNWNITVWEWEQPSQVVESYWEAEARAFGLGSMNKRILDPFGLVTWPGSVVATQALKDHSDIVKDHSVLILGAGVGVEAQAVAELEAKHVLATDIHPTTLKQLEMGVAENNCIRNKNIVQTQIFDLMGDEALPLPSADLIVVADVLYNEQLASNVVRRLVEGWQRNPMLKILITDSQRFVDVLSRINDQFSSATRGGVLKPNIQLTEETLNAFTGSGVCIEGDQTYDVKVQKIWIGLD